MKISIFLLLPSFALWAKIAALHPQGSLEALIQQAQPHDTIYIYPGRYYVSELVITKPLYIIGIGKPILDGGYKGSILRIKADSFLLKNVFIKNVGRSVVKDHAGLIIVRSHHFVVDSVEMDSVFFGILVEKSSHGTIKNCYIHSQILDEVHSGNGIHLWYCDSMLVEYNNIWGMRDGIYFEFVTHSTIRYNYSHDNLRYGLHFMFSHYDTYHHNRFERCGAGVAVMFSKFITMHHNLFINNWGPTAYGLLLKEIYDTRLYENRFERNTVAIQIETCTRVRYERNWIANNGWAINMRGGSYNNHFFENVFIANTFDVAYEGRINQNRFEGNFWGKYTGYDLDRDGWGDVPFHPVELFSFIIQYVPEAIVLIRSLFVDLLNFVEKIVPVITPVEIQDAKPKMFPQKPPLSITFVPHVAHSKPV